MRNFIEASIFILFFAILSVPLANRFRLPLEIFLVIGSSFIGILGVSAFQINPQIVFYFFLPIILFHAAYFTSWHDFKFNLRPISLLALGLVIFTMVAVALIAKGMFPTLSWGEAFLLGAIISPTDASAATAMIKKLGSPRRLITVLEGESLVNDATALLLFRFSLTAVILGSFSMGQALTQFVIVTGGGAVIGLLVGFAAVFLLQQLKDTQAETTLTFITAFTCYMVAERFHVSGVIATVVCGIYFGIRFPEFTSSLTRMNAKVSWNILLFIVNCFVFTLIGLELPWIIQNLSVYSLPTLILYGIAISFLVILVRMVWIFPMAYLSRLFPAVARKDPNPSLSALFVLSWAGMRGIVSLAAALSLPYRFPNGEPFSHRDLLIFITYCVIVVTLILPSLTLPTILKLLHLTNNQNKMKEEAIARIQSLQGVLEKIIELAEKEKISCDILNDFRKQIERRLQVIKTQLNDTPYSTLTDDYISFKKLTVAALAKERETLIQLRRSGDIHDEVFHQLSDELDLEELRTKSLRI